MGDCTSKPNYIEIENHVKYISSVNDAFFHEPVLLGDKERSELLSGLDALSSDSQSTADSYLYSLNSQLLKTNQRLSQDEEKSKAKLVVEIRKGIDIYPVGRLNPKGVLVKVKTAPAKQEAESTLSEVYIPKWYSLVYFLFGEDEAIDTVAFEVYSKAVTGEETLFATLSLSLRETTDQTVTKWYLLSLNDLYSGLGIKPQLELRIWLLKNQYSFWYHVKEALEREMQEVNTALIRSRTGLAA